MSPLQLFAAFIRTTKFEEFVFFELQTLLSYNVPLMKKFDHWSNEEKLERTRISLQEFLISIEKGKGIETVEQKLEEWKANSLPDVSKTDVGVTDLVLIYSAQKYSLVSFIPHFTTDAAIAIGIALELEQYYKRVQDMAVNIMQEIDREEKEKLKETEAKYKDLFENATDLVQFVDIEGRILYVNDAWQKTMGYTSRELEGTYIFDYIAENERENYKNYRVGIINKQPASEAIHTCFIAKNNSKVFIEGYISCRYKNGNPEYTRGILRDVTKRKESLIKLEHANKTLQEREESLKQLITNAPDAIIVIDQDNKILLWNPKAETVFGWTASEVVGKDLTDTIIPDELKQGHRDGVARLVRTGETRLINTTVTITAVTKSRQSLFISLTLSQSLQAGKLIFISFIRDITQQKKNENELEIQRKQLVQSNLQLEQYAWLVSHDLKEPLRKIITYSDLVLNRHADNVPETTKNYLHKIFDSTQRMEKLINAILQYSQLSDTQEQFENTDLASVVNEVVADLEMLIASKKALIKVNKLPTIQAIPVQISQLFQNLITNALKYSKPTQPPVVEIDSQCDEGSCTITVKDNGIGFDAKYADQIFVVFQRLKSNNKEEGTGIGLAICKKIVETHNGTIHAESTEGVGTSFVITLPLVQSDL